MEDEVDGARVVLHVEPVAHVLAPAVHRQRFAVAYIVDEQRDELFGELVRAVVVRAVCDNGRQPVGVVERPHEVVARGLRGGIGGMRLVLEVFGEELLAVGQMVLPAGRLGGEWRIDAFGAGHLQRTVHLVGGDVVEAAGNRRSLGFARDDKMSRFPRNLRGLQQGERPHHVGLREGKRVADGTVDVALGGEVDDAVDLLVLHQLQHPFEIADVHLHEAVVRPVLDVFQVREIPRVGELVEVDDPVIGIFVDEQPDYMAADEPGAAGDDDGTFWHGL